MLTKLEHWHTLPDASTISVWLESPEGNEDDWTWRNGLEFLAVHTTYHLDKIVLLRQIMDIWPPPIGGDTW